MYRPLRVNRLALPNKIDGKLARTQPSVDHTGTKYDGFLAVVVVYNANGGLGFYALRHKLVKLPTSIYVKSPRDNLLIRGGARDAYMRQ